MGVVLALGALTWIVVFRLAVHLVPLLDTVWDVWFQSDTARTYANMTNRWSSQARANVHPLFSLWTLAPVSVIARAFQESRVLAVAQLMATVATLLLLTFYTLLRLLGCRSADAAIFAALLLTSAASLFWLPVPDVWRMGSLTMVLMLVVVAAAEHRMLRPWQFAVTSALTMSVTVTNWMVGIFATFSRYNRRQATRITVAAFALVVAAWSVESRVLAQLPFPLARLQNERVHMLTGFAISPQHIAQSFFFHSIVMPQFKTIEVKCEGWTDKPQMVTQLSAVGSGGRLGAVATVAWSLLLVLGGWALVTLRVHAPLRLTLAGATLGQFVLHLLYGGETFLYALHFAPLLVTIAALSALTRARPLALALALTVILCGVLNNAAMLATAIGDLPWLDSTSEPHVASGEYVQAFRFAGRACSVETIARRAEE